MRRIVVLATGCLLLVLCGLSAVFADGAFFGPELVRAPTATERTDIYEPQQKGFIWCHDGLEDLVLQVSYSGAVTDFAWVVPVPARPEVRKVDGALFHELSRLTQAWAVTGVALHFGRNAARGYQGGVAVLERKEVGHYDVSVLAASEPGALVNWLDGHGYVQPPGAEDVLRPYVEAAWYFVACRIAAGHEDVAGKLRSGHIEPLRLTFSAESPVYPLRISSLNPGGTEVLLYVAAPHAVRAEGLREEFCARVDGVTRGYPTLRRIVHGDFVITKLRGGFAQADMVEDIVLAERGGQVPPLDEVRAPDPPLHARIALGFARGFWATVRGIGRVGRTVAGWAFPHNWRARYDVEAFVTAAVGLVMVGALGAMSVGTGRAIVRRWRRPPWGTVISAEESHDPPPA